MAKCMICGEFRAELCPECGRQLTPAEKAGPELLRALLEVRQCLKAITMPGEYEHELRQADTAIQKAGG